MIQPLQEILKVVEPRSFSKGLYAAVAAMMVMQNAEKKRRFTAKDIRSYILRAYLAPDAREYLVDAQNGFITKDDIVRVNQLFQEAKTASGLSDEDLCGIIARSEYGRDYSPARILGTTYITKDTVNVIQALVNRKEPPHIIKAGTRKVEMGPGRPGTRTVEMLYELKTA